ncbi:hypothetical protein ECE50_016135 [Chitinophaga sp. Mgbs1]|uniref:Uncharacterized protein n=1 Tax=Chitinophaga solisilvae TaxID=1233460 RepID=A0A3S1DMP1_9BACT|nr:hypothetical protein [Chitinophaga solisilvae]
MKQEEIDYIFRHYHHFLTLMEVAAEKQVLSNQPEVQELLKDGAAIFRMRTAERLLREFPEQIYFNNCPQCGRLARTPQAQQCRYCLHCWRD